MEKMWRNKDTYDPTATIDKDTFKQLLQIKTDYLAERLYYVMKGEEDGDTMSLHQLRTKVEELTTATFTFKLHFLFRLFDFSNSGLIKRDHLHSLLHSSVHESTLLLGEDDVSRLSDALFDDVSDGISGDISWEQWSQHFHLYPHLINNFTLQVPAIYDSRGKMDCHFSMPRHLTLTYFRNNKVKAIFALTFILLNVTAGSVNAWLYRHHNWLIVLARSTGMCLNVSCTIAMCLMLRKTLTFLHHPPLAACLPLDHHVAFHKMAGYFIVFLSLVHTLCHVANAAIYVAASSHLNLLQCLFTLRADIGWLAGFAPLSGVLLFLLVSLLFLCSMEYVRRWTCFEVFYWTHKLSIPILVLTVLHAANFWKWIIAPVFLFCVEQGLKLKAIWASCTGQLYCQSVALFPSGVAELTITRPEGFDFHAGDYIFLNIPVIARYEWHPFTISSQPQRRDTMTIHVGSVGYWTRYMYSYFKDRTRNLSTSPKDQTTGPDVNIMEEERNHSGTVPILSEMRQNKGEAGNVNYGCIDLQQVDMDTPDTKDVCVPNQEQKPGVKRMSELTTAENSVNTVTSLNQEQTDKRTVSDLENEHYDRLGVGVDTDQVQNQAGEHGVILSANLLLKQTDGQAVQNPQDMDGKGNSTSKVVEPVIARDLKTGNVCPVHVPVYVDGPYGTPSRHILQAEHAILIGSGIGVTPFASVLQSMVSLCCGKGGSSAARSSPCFPHRRPVTLRKVDFIWINRELSSFDWFLPVLTKMEREQSRDDGPGHVIDMQMYLTSAPSREDVRGVGLQMAVDAMFRQQGRDFFTGLQTPTRLGRPRFDQIFTDIAQKAAGKIQVFFCGSPALRQAVKIACATHGIHFCQEHF